MDGGGAAPKDRLDHEAIGQGPQLATAADEPEGPEGRASTRASTQEQEGTPWLALDGFDGPLERLLTLARAQQFDLSRISLTALLDQLEAAFRQAPARMPLGQKGDWVVMAAWLLELRSRLLLPADTPAQQDATAEADALLGRLVALQAMQALAGWLERRPQLGRDVFGRGKPEVLGVSVEPTPDLDIIEFLWASLALFDDGEPAPDTTTGYSPPRLPLYPLGEARTRILRLLAEASGEATFEQLLPALSHVADSSASTRALRRRSAWSSTLIASLELAKQGDVVVAQEGLFQPIHLARV